MAFLGPVERLRHLVVRCLGAALLSAWALAPLSAAGATAPPTSREAMVKAVFLFNFTRFVRWPEELQKTDRPVVIGVLGRDPFGPALDAAVKGEDVSGRRLEVRRIENLEQALECDELFIAASEEPELPKVLAFLAGKAVLTVSDIPGFAARGGMIGLVPSEGRVKIQINPEEAKAAGLQISSKLLRPAEIVSTRRRSNSNQRGTKNIVERSFAPKVERVVHVDRFPSFFAAASLSDHGRSDPRAPRSGAVPQQRVERQDGLRARDGGGAARVAG